MRMQSLLSSYLESQELDVQVLPSSLRSMRAWMQRFEEYLEDEGLLGVDSQRMRIAQWRSYRKWCVEYRFDKGPHRGQRLAPKTVQNYLQSVRRLARYGAMEGLVPSSVYESLRADWRQTENARKRKRVVAPDDREELIRTSEPDEESSAYEFWKWSRLHALMVLLFDTGIRAVEARRLTWDDVDFVRCRLRVVQKGLTPATKVMSRRAADSLRRLRRCELERECKELAEGPQGLCRPVFMSRLGTRWQYNEMLKAFSEHCRRALGKTGIGLHWMRHTWATTAAKAKMPVTAIQKQLGHTKVEYSRSYIHEDLADIDTDVGDFFDD